MLRISEGVLSTATDLVLFELYYTPRAVASAASKKPRDKYSGDSFLHEVNYKTIKRAVYHLKRKGLVDYIRDEAINIPIITDQGKERLEAMLPRYHTTRFWDGKIYLITYDIPETQRGDRDILRRHIRKIGGGRLQDSVWICPYNPRNILKKTIKERGLSGDVIISDVGEDGSIGQKTLKELVSDVYDLDHINSSYAIFLRKHRKTKKDYTKSQIAFDFFAVLDEDPQLPYELLPYSWLGDDAYELFCELTGKEQPHEVKP